MGGHGPVSQLAPLNFFSRSLCIGNQGSLVVIRVNVTALTNKYTMFCCNLFPVFLSELVCD